jgi:hypothetical protein
LYSRWIRILHVHGDFTVFFVICILGRRCTSDIRVQLWFFTFQSPIEVDSSTEGFCYQKFPPYAVTFENEAFLVMDNSEIEEYNGGVDKFLNSPQGCPGAPSDGSLIVPTQEIRTDDDAQSQIELFTEWFNYIEDLSTERDTNFYVGHRPLLAIGCNWTDIVTLDWTLQQSLSQNTLHRISAIISGHMHWLGELLLLLFLSFQRT